MQFGVRHEIDVMFDVGHLAEVAVPYFVVSPSTRSTSSRRCSKAIPIQIVSCQYLAYLAASFCDCATWNYTQTDWRLPRRSSSRWTMMTASSSAFVHSASDNGT